MFTTIVCAAVFTGLLLATAVLWAMFLRLGLRWTKVPEVTTRQVILVTAIVIVLHFAITLLFLFIAPTSDAQSVILGLVQLLAAIVVPCAVISTVFKVRFAWALQAWLPTLLASVMVLAFSLLVVRPFLYAGFVIPTNSMAPTLVGPHWKGTCPECGKPTYCTPLPKQYETADPPLMICENFHITESSDINETVHVGDRFLVAKFLAPRRWDLVVFQEPSKPSILSVKRLVGLPGEKVHIQDGSVWINDVRQTPPDSLRGIEYSSEFSEGAGPGSSGSKDRPALLGKDEYFVLGDFSTHSNDSRYWEQGAPGRNPFAVPESHMKGVVTHTYWPTSRLRIHR